MRVEGADERRLLVLCVSEVAVTCQLHVSCVQAMEAQLQQLVEAERFDEAAELQEEVDTVTANLSQVMPKEPYIKHKRALCRHKRALHQA